MGKWILPLTSMFRKWKLEAQKKTNRMDTIGRQEIMPCHGASASVTSAPGRIEASTGGVYCWQGKSDPGGDERRLNTPSIRVGWQLTRL